MNAIQSGFRQPRKVVKRILIWAAILTFLIWLWPIEYRITRIAFIGGLLTIWASVLFLTWNRKRFRFSLVLFGAIPLIAVSLPGRPTKPLDSRTLYAASLHDFLDTRYVWGGENRLGIDCSGLVRQGMIRSQLKYGLLGFNGTPIRRAVEIWWHDSSAMALRDGYRDWTIPLLKSEGISDLNHDLLQVGDLAITSDGVHVLVYVGGQEWIEADPDFKKVVKIKLPTTSQWFHQPVTLARWRWLQ